MIDYKQLANLLSKHIPANRVITDPNQCFAYGTDASFYRLIPKIILQVDNAKEVQAALKLTSELNAPITFRAAGTSLSGQAISDSVLIMLTPNWQSYRILEQGKKIKLQPGIIGAHANQYLAPYHRKIGPDPASINACKIGGIAANNASGMCCGTAQNTYHTLSDISVILHDGTRLDTSNVTSVEQFKASHAEFLDALLALSHQTKANHQLCKKINHKYRLKNTTGYSLNALIDFEDPIDILSHLMIGSEGTLGFIEDITYHTVPDPAFKASGLFIFPTMNEASLAVMQLTKLPVAAVELMDNRSLSAIANKAGVPTFLSQLPKGASALLIEVQNTKQDGLDDDISQIMSAFESLNRLEQVKFTQDLDTITTLWNIRKGLFPAVGAVREMGSSVIIEDVTFPIENLASGIEDLSHLFEKYGYDEAIIFGHALVGNLHFVFTQTFENAAQKLRYKNFMEDVCQLVAVKYGGSLKAEHGTGRNMAPFVALEWGDDAYQLMCQIKSLFDPKNLCNPGVIINHDPEIHLKNLKQLPAANDVVDACIECGFCEPVCPSKNLTLTPRQRITTWRKIQSLRRAIDLNPAEHQLKSELEELEKFFEYHGIETCAATGLCQSACPVGINTGNLILSLRNKTHQSPTKMAVWTHQNFAKTTQIARFGLTMNQWSHNLIGAKPTQYLAQTAAQYLLKTPFQWNAYIPQANPVSTQQLIKQNQSTQRLKNQSENSNKSERKLKPATNLPSKVIYFASCISRTVNQDTNKKSLSQVVLTLLQRLNIDVVLLEHMDELCCGSPYKSKGFDQLSTQKSQQLSKNLSDKIDAQGITRDTPILIETSPCTLQMQQNHPELNFVDASTFIYTHIAPNLTLHPIDETIMLHITCSSRKMGISDKLYQIAKQCARDVIIPHDIYCCGWAGDKGFITPELNQSALAGLKSQVPKECSRGFSTSQTCEIGLSLHSGINYQSILYLIDEASA